MKSLFSFSMCLVSKILVSNKFFVIVRRVLVPSVAALLPIAVSFAQTQFNGTYTGSWSGTRLDGTSDTGTFTVTVANGVITGTVTGTSTSISGTISSSGAITASAKTPCATVTFTGQATITSSAGASATGTFSNPESGPGCKSPSTGTWTATRTATTGVVVDSEIPADFTLLQSYPNPFNPTATIEYHVPVSGFVKLSVYDILGREITLLVNENKSVGKHRVTFDASGLPGGVYFYRMQAGQFQETRKLVLLK